MKTIAKKPFSLLAPYYDAVYHRKHYTKEVKVIDNLIKKYVRDHTPTLLDIGVGTGEHLVEFIHRGYQASGIDLSKQMLRVAKQKLSRENLSATLICADARDFQTHHTYDVVVSLFHVLSYQTTTRDMVRFFTQAAAHMKQNGVFIFDCWYGPGVLALPPEDSIQLYNQGKTVIKRHKHPIHDPKTNTVSVHHAYSILKPHAPPTHFTEIHNVRYFFLPEIKEGLKEAGLKIINWGTLGKNLTRPKKDAWEIHIVAQKI